MARSRSSGSNRDKFRLQFWTALTFPVFIAVVSIVSRRLPNSEMVSISDNIRGDGDGASQLTPAIVLRRGEREK